MSLTDILSSIDFEISRLEQARKVLASDGARIRGDSMSSGKPARRKRTFSAASRKRMAEAQRKRWATQKKVAK